MVGSMWRRTNHDSADDCIRDDGSEEVDDNDDDDDDDDTSNTPRTCFTVGLASRRLSKSSEFSMMVVKITLP